MKLFDNINELEKEFSKYKNELDFVHKKIFDLCEDEIYPITRLRNKFSLKTNDFISKDRKLNIGIIGQIKTGRSTFLNTLIFDGEDVLPKAVTPKTAIVTKIIYAKRNFIEVEYYSKEELEILKIEVPESIYLDYYLKLVTQKIECGSYQTLKRTLDDYISENGKLTPIVKSVIINIKNEKIKDICIIDTPGLNDPVLSRSNKTKDFLETCDVVFFLSRSSQFLDKNDVELLYTKLPQKGVKKLVLVCSRVDDALNDKITDYESLESTYICTKKLLNKHAKKVYSEISNLFKEREVQKELLNILKTLEKPIFMSSMCCNMVKKEQQNYNESENNIFENLNYHNDVTLEILNEIGNFSEIERLLHKVTLKKEEILISKSKTFISDLEQELSNILNNIINTFQKRIDFLKNINKADLELQKSNMISQTNNISANLDEAFSQLYTLIDENKIETLEELNNSKDKSYELKEKASKKEKIQTDLVSISKWFNPNTWGKKQETEIETTEVYSYLDPNDALNQLKTYANLCSDTIENTFTSSLEIEKLRQKLLEVVVLNHDTADINYDPFFFKLIVSKTLDSLTLPIINVNITSLLNIVSTKFTGEVRNTNDMISLRILLVVCVNSFIKDLEDTFFNEIDIFKQQLNELKEDFYSKLLENVIKEYDLILLHYSDRENKVENYHRIIKEITLL